MAATSDSPAPVDPLIGQEVGGSYRIVRAIGTGGMGTVYEARHLRLNRKCAVKVLLQSLQDDPTYLERFRREAEVTSGLKNRHICEVLDFNHLADGSPYLAMEFLEGEDLASRIKRRPLTPKEMAPIIEGIGSALSAAHKIGVVHRDIKPANIFLAKTAEGTEIAKLLDFGAAKRQGTDANLTATGQVLGSVWYVSPEQARGQELDQRTDVFSLGIVLFEGLTGRNPFEAPTPTDTLFKIVSDPAPSVRSIIPSLAPNIDEVMAKALAKRREERFSTAAELSDAAIAVLDPTLKKKPRPSLDSMPAVSTVSAARPVSPQTQSASNASTVRALVERGLLNPAQLEQALAWDRTEGELLFDKLVTMGLVDERKLLRFVAGNSGFKYITSETLAKSRVPQSAVAKLPAQIAEARCVAPLAFEASNSQLTVAIAEPNLAVLDEIKQKTGVGAVQAILALRGTIRAAIRRFYPAEALSPSTLVPRTTPAPIPNRATPAPMPLNAFGSDGTVVAPRPAQVKPFVDVVSGTGPTPIPETEFETFQTPRAKEPAREPDTHDVPDLSIIDPLVSAKLLDDRSLEQARQLQRERGGFLGDAILRLGLVKEVDFLRTFAELYGTRFVKSDKVVKVSFDASLLEQIPARTAEELRVLPFARNPAAGEIHVIAAVPLSAEIASKVIALTGARAVTVYLATPGAVQAALRRWYYGDPSVLSEVTQNGAGPGPMRPRSTPGAAEPDSIDREIAEREQDASQRTVQVSLEDAHATGPNLPSAPVVVAASERPYVDLQKRLGLDGDPARALDALLEVLPLESAALVLDDGRKAVRGLRANTNETVPRARVELAQGSRMPVHTENASNDPLLGASRLVREKGVKAALTLPLVGRARVLGALHVDSREPFSTERQKDLAMLAELIALRLEDAAAVGRAHEEARVAQARERFLPPALRRALSEGSFVLPGEGQLVQATLLYAQLRDTDELGGRMSASEIVAGLNRAWAMIGEMVGQQGGAIAEVRGTRMVAVWSPALGVEADAARAIDVALAMQQKIGLLQLGGRAMTLRVGLHSGLVTIGRIGTPEHFDYGVLGSASKLVSRMAQLALDGQVIASEPTLQRAGSHTRVKPIPMQTVQDLGPPTVAFLIGALAAEEVELGD